MVVVAADVAAADDDYVIVESVIMVSEEEVVTRRCDDVAAAADVVGVDYDADDDGCVDDAIVAALGLVIDVAGSVLAVAGYDECWVVASCLVERTARETRWRSKASRL